MEITAHRHMHEEGQVEIRRPGCTHIISNTDARSLSNQLDAAVGLVQPESHDILRMAINQRQHELANSGRDWKSDFMLNAMQQVYYTMDDEERDRGPNAQVFELNAAGEKMLADGPQKFVPPEAE